MCRDNERSGPRTIPMALSTKKGGAVSPHLEDHSNAERPGGPNPQGRLESLAISTRPVRHRKPRQAPVLAAAALFTRLANRDFRRAALLRWM